MVNSVFAVGETMAKFQFSLGGCAKVPFALSNCNSWMGFENFDPKPQTPRAGKIHDNNWFSDSGFVLIICVFIPRWDNNILY